MSARILPLLALTLACGARTGPGARPEPVPQPQPAVAQVGELQLALRPRATAGLVRASLWIDAGSRDGDPPATATLAAWAAGEGLATPGMATPDATVFETRCEKDALSECLAPLGAALATRELTPEAHALLRDRLTRTRRRAATDPERRAEVLAIAAVLEEPGVDPLGTAEDDERLTREAVHAFLRDHYGTGRVLLVLQGDLPADARAQVERTAAGWPRAEATRGTREGPSAGARSAAETATASSTALAALFDGSAAASRAADDLEGARLFALRGGTVVLVHTRRRALEERAHRLATLTLVASEADEGDSVDEPDEPSDPTTAIVSRWLGAGEGSVRALGVGAACAEGRGLPDLDTCATRVRGALERAVAAAAPEREGSVDGERGDLRLANGAQVLTRRAPGPVGVVVRFAGGPNESPPGAHGRSAIAARALAMRCPVVVRPFVESTGWGLVYRGDRQGIPAVVRCALAEPDADTVTAARHRVRAIARQRPARGWAARLIAPGSPGLVAPEGSDSGAASVLGVDRFLADQRVGARTTVAVVGDVDPSRASDAVAPLLGALPAGEPPAAVERVPADITLRAESHPARLPRIGVAFTVPAQGRGAATAARAFAKALAEAATEAGLRIHAWDGGASEGIAWALIAFDIAEDQLEGVPARVERAARSARVDLGAMSEALRWSTGDPRRAARRLARDGTTEPPTPDPTVVERLRTASPAFVIGRREPGLGFPTLQRREAASR